MEMMKLPPDEEMDWFDRAIPGATFIGTTLEGSFIKIWENRMYRIGVHRSTKLVVLIELNPTPSKLIEELEKQSTWN
jgi:hypothetical protein